jgi:hypothetical protein
MAFLFSARNGGEQFGWQLEDREPDMASRSKGASHERNLAVAVLEAVITLVTLTLGRRRESQPPPAAVEELPAPVPAETRKERQWTSV